ncbi:exodeoxyribonuclease V subunit alpha [Mycolicibacter arupensis]|uniref:RecBCD enzyme subunit RecD n=1 Tax=Mycolicibacter arupensis TaxID=342002 RepID=A0A5C7XXX6_9MYCO|nr:exodeoxyribonuclease V subunit alpha [Mycolicibacter arupensis]TXI54341.1 MAG: exodeoxyribonuclease V subunit alpha [Mycolicibacter arupensis]
MSELLEWRVACGATGLLRDFNQAGVLDAADVHAAQRITALGGDPDETVGLALALTVRALRHGSVCLDLASVAADTDAVEVPWPEPGAWLAAVQTSRLVQAQVLRLYDGRLLYLDRYWREEEQVCTDLLALSAPGTAPAQLPAFDRLFPPGRFDEQRAAAEIAVSQPVTVLTGGPGTGKTTTVARLLALLAEHAERSGMPGLRIALAAPTGKAAARLTEAVAAEVAELEPVDRARLAGLGATTLHTLLGSRPDTSVRFRHDRANRLPHDAIVVDETSMVSLTLMARLLEAMRPDARLILVGDADQLASVEAGAVLADLVEGLEGRPDTRVATLQTSHRFGESIGALAVAIRDGDADTAIALLAAGGDHVEWIDTDHPVDVADRLAAVVVPHALAVRQAALLGDATAAAAALDEHRLLCAHREGLHGVRHWNQQIRRLVAEQTGDPMWTEWYAGRPLLVTVNDYGLGLRNGDTGAVVVRNEGLRAVISTASGPLEFATSRLAEVETMYAMTIHKSQGSQAGEVTVLMPPVESRLLTRELFYTAVTRAKSKVRVIGSEASVRAALDRRVVRASGLALRLRQA